MTISIDAIRANGALALRLIGEECSGAVIGDEFLEDAPSFQPILPTTWEALEQARYVARLGLGRFQLTSNGFVKALTATGKLCGEEMKRDLGLLSAKLKARLDRYEGPTMVGTHEIVSETGLPHYWVVNAITCDLISLCLKRHGAHWPPGDRSETTIEIPARFGHPIDPAN